MNIAAVPCFAVGISSFTKLACRQHPQLKTRRR
jgi:hypothetical protein